jgi:hypothetical protein
LTVSFVGLPMCAAIGVARIRDCHEGGALQGHAMWRFPAVINIPSVNRGLSEWILAFSSLGRIVLNDGKA